MNSIDVVFHRNNLRKLLSFVTRATYETELEPFTIKLEVTKNTLIMCRDETATHVNIGPNEFRGYGREFEKIYTKNQIKNSTGHHRIISYRFCGLQFIIQHETDACVTVKPKTPETQTLSHKLESLSLSPDGNSFHTNQRASKLRVILEGQSIPLESTLEIKTRTIKKPILLHEVASQLWVSQTPKLVRAYHSRGTFREPSVTDEIIATKKWEEENEKTLRTLGALIKKLLAIVGGCGGQAAVKYDDKEDKLIIWRVQAKRMLPDDLYFKWREGSLTDAAESKPE